MEFTKWFMKVSIDQVQFCARSFDLRGLGDRYRKHLGMRFTGDERPGRLVAKVLEMGEMHRGAAPSMIGGSERTARNVLATCIRHGFLKSDTSKGDVRVAFPQSDLPWIFPNLFGDDQVPERPPPLNLGMEDAPPPPRIRKKDEWER